MASGFSLQASSSLLICAVVICLARSCSCSVGVFTSQGRKLRSSIRGILHGMYVAGGYESYDDDDDDSDCHQEEEEDDEVRRIKKK